MQHVYVHRVHHPPHFTHSRARFRLISCRCVVLFSHALGIVFNFVALQSSLMERRIPTCVSPSPTVPRYRALAEIQCSGAPRLSRHTVSHIICTHSAGAPRYPTNVICACVRACVVKRRRQAHGIVAGTYRGSSPFQMHSQHSCLCTLHPCNPPNNVVACGCKLGWCTCRVRNFSSCQRLRARRRYSSPLMR